ncbi:site-2 protease family protein [Leekyejoonella antrihumi]|uniref:Peptidase M50 n=1 Tax=Leekyejoonella antrihumi TaxID=1660198 RepID=A0A563DT89_9MICO|nr:site-2 protease family protein [Leekyejoonella antrihumi]TWP33203.1 peptidase M50 [Leekyejoonella antrihumi]
MPSSTPSRAPGWRIGSIRGIPIYLGRTWPLIAVVIVVTFGPQVTTVVPGLGNRGYLVALLYAILLLLSVLAHELSHAVVGQWCGYRVRQIMADLWGGHTAYDAEDGSPLSSALVSVVGPVSNGVLALLGWLLLPSVPDGVPRLLTIVFVWSNAFVAIFNVLPGLPLDGGFLVEAAVWKVSGSRPLGLLVAGWCGRVVTVLLVAGAIGWPLVHGHRPSLITVIWALFLAGFLWFGAGNAVARATAERLFARVRIADVLHPVCIADDQTLVAQVRPDIDAAVRDRTGRVWGLATASARRQIPAGQDRVLPLRAVARVQPDGWVCEVDDPNVDVTELVRSAQEAGEGVEHILVVDVGQRPLGVVSVAELGGALRRADGHA